MCLALWTGACEGGGRGGGTSVRGDSSVSATDDVGRQVELARPAERVVSLLPAATETLAALGARDRVVGRTRYDTDTWVAHLPSVGGGLDPNVSLTNGELTVTPGARVVLFAGLPIQTEIVAGGGTKTVNPDGTA
ncbi:MAG: hypothetical protein KY464_16940, partial [Gemmatimonadetes bacterium]|nr:hypothetical protein [Gemmatimonadota bacterium]